MRFTQVPELHTAEYLDPTGYEPKLPFLCTSYVHMAQHSKSKPGSPTEPVSTNVTCAQDNTPQLPMTDQEMNKPFMLVLSVPHDADFSAIFPPVMDEISIFPVDRDNDTMHTFIVDKIDDMTSDAMKSFFTMMSEIHNAIRRLVKEHYKHDATGNEYFWFLTSQRPDNNNVAIMFCATCQQCLCLDSPSG